MTLRTFLPAGVVRWTPVFLALTAIFTSALPTTSRAGDLLPGPPSINKFVADPERPLLYAVHRDGENDGKLLVFDTLTREMTHAIPVGREPTSLDVTEDGSKIWVLNAKDPSLTAVSTTTFEVLETIPLEEYTNRNRAAANPGPTVKTGPGDIVYYLDEQWGPRLRVFDTATRTVLQTLSAESGSSPDTSNNFGYGCIGVDHQRSRLFGWRVYGDSAGVGGSHIVRFDIKSDGTLENFTRSANYGSTNFDRSPYDTPVLIGDEGSRVFIKDREVDTEDPDAFPLIFPQPLYSLAGNAMVASSATAIYATDDARKLAPLPVTATVQTILPDLTALVYFDPETRDVGWLDLMATLGGEALGLDATPADGSVVTAPSRLEWPGFTGISRYRVYLGSSEEAVNAAAPGSPSDLGETTGTSIDLATAPGIGRHFWRVVPLDGDGGEIGGGATFSFTVANLAIDRNSIRAATLAGNPDLPGTIGLSSPDPVEWSATTAESWIQLANASGITPDALDYVLDASELPAGEHTGHIHIASGGVTSVIPVTLTLYAPQYTLARADLDLPRIYAVSESGAPNEPACLVVIDTESGGIIRVLPVGSSVTSMSVHYAENRVYLTNWRAGLLRAFDRDGLEEDRVYQFNPPGGGARNSGDAYVVAAGRDGRVMLEQQDQSIDVFLVDTATGEKIATAPGVVRQGGGVFDPTGRFYYHGDSNSTGASLHKFDTAGDEISRVGNQRVSAFSNFGSRLVHMSGNGYRIFWNGGVFDPDLNVLMQLNEEVVASTYRGEVLFTKTRAINGSNGAVLATLPVSTEIQAVSGDQRKLFLFDGDAITTVDIAAIAEVPPPGLVPGIADEAVVVGASQELTWSQEAAAISHDVYFGTSAAAVAAADVDSPEFLGNVTGTRWTGDLPDLEPGGDYFWRVDVRYFDSLTTGDTWSFQIAPVDVTPRRLDLATPVGAPLPRQLLEMDSDEAVAWSASSSTPWITVTTPEGTTPDELEFDVDATGLGTGTHNGAVQVVAGGVAIEVPVSISVFDLNFTLARADLELSRIYAVSETEGTDQPAHLLVLDADDGEIIHSMAVGSSVTSMSVHYGENRVYLTNWRDGLLRAIDRDSLEEVRVYQFNVPTGTGRNSGDAYVVAAGRDGRVMLEQQDQWIDIFLVDTATGGKIATGPGSIRQGGGLFDRAGRFYYHGESNSTGASLKKFDTEGDSLVLVGSKRVSSFNHFGSRLVEMSGDGSRIFWNGGVFDPDLNVLMELNEEVVASTYRGEVLFTGTRAINGSNGEVLATLPVDTKIQAVSGDQRKLFLFDGDAITTVDIATIADVPHSGLVPGIADEAVVIGTDQEITWSQEAAAISYDVYFGTSAAAVAAADAESPEFLGNVTGTRWTGDLPGLELGGGYYWRVDVHSFDSLTIGDTWSFRIAPVDVTPRRVELTAPSSAPVPRQTLETASPGPIEWVASTTTPWITVVTPDGTTPDELRFDITADGLDAGTHHGAVRMVSDGIEFEVPVELSVVTLNITRLVPHPDRPVVYAIQDTPVGEGFSHVFELDAATAEIRRTLPIGFAPTDADLDAANGRLYVTNWGYSQTRVVDVDAWIELPPLSLGTDVFRIAATPDGRLITEEQDQWIRLGMWDAATGEELATRGQVRQGDGVVHPSGNHYYHADSSISNAAIRRFDIRENSFEPDLTSPQIGSGSRNLVMSPDGSRFFWQGRVLDEELNVRGLMPGEIHATNATGDIAVGETAIWWTDSGVQAAALPFSSTVAAVSAEDAHLVRFNAATRTLHSTPLAELADLPGPRPRPGQLLDESPDSLSWSPVAGATSYRVFIAESAASLEAMTAPTAVVGAAFLEISDPLDSGRNHFWCVDAVTDEGVVTGAVHEFGIAFPMTAALPAVGSSSSNQRAVSLTHRHLLVGGRGEAQLFDFDSTAGTVTPVETFREPSLATSDLFGFAVAMDGGRAVIGAPSTGGAQTGGFVSVYRPGGLGFWEHGGRNTPPDPVANERFGSHIAADGNLMLVGTDATGTSETGRVVAYLAEPDLIETQVLQADDAEAGDGFGRIIAMEGNHAVIAAPGRGTWFNPQPVLYAFNRSTATGVWSQSQKISIPDVSTSNNAIRSLALSGNLMATATSDGDVLIYRRVRTGMWNHTATIRRQDVPGATSSFGSSIALAGDQLFVGDTGAIDRGVPGGAVFSFRRTPGAWMPGPLISPLATRTSFGIAMAVRDHWLVVGSRGNQAGWLFRIAAGDQRAPQFAPVMQTQVITGREFSIPVQVENPAGNGAFAISRLQGPSWLQVEDQGDGNARLHGTPPPGAGPSSVIQLRASNATGGTAHYAFNLMVLEPTDFPTLDASPSAADLGVGQQLLLRADVSGIGPFQWQWFRDGEAIEGANEDHYLVNEVGFSDAGRYHVRVSNFVGPIESDPVDVTVRAADRFAGDWPTFGGSPAHTGRHPAALDATWFQPAWSRELQQDRVLNRAVIAEGRAIVVPQGRFASGLAVKAVDLESGVELWNYPFPSAFSSNPPSIHDGRVYFQRGNHANDSQLISLDAATGAEVWEAPFRAQWESYEAPAISGMGIFINGGSFGGMYGFDFDGNERFFANLAQVSGWTPTILQDRLFSWTNGSFIEHLPGDGNTIWELTGLQGTGIVAARDDAAVINSNGLTCIDLPTRSVRWRVDDGNFGQPAIGGDHVFAIFGNAVRSHALHDGTPGLVYQTDAGTTTAARLIDQPILFNDRLAVSNESTTWIFDIGTAELMQTLDAGGRLSYSNGYLLAAGDDGVLRAFYATPHGRVAISGPEGEPVENDGEPVRVGAPPVGSSGVTTLTLANSGLDDLGEMVWSIEGEHAADFALGESQPAMLVPGAEVVVEITHTPSDKGLREAVLVLASDDPTQPEFRIPVFALPPDVELFAATDITGVSATLNGNAVANDNDIALVFEYGLTPEFGTTVAADPAAMYGEDEGPVSAEITGLPPGTLHHYRIGATNAEGTHWSEGMTFTTLSDNARLEGITSRIFLGETFDPDVFDYFGTLGFDRDSVEVRPRPEHPGATVTVQGEPVTGFIDPIPLQVGNNTITIVVTAEDGITTLTYTIVATRLPQEFMLDGGGGVPVVADGFRAVGTMPPIQLGFHPDPGAELMLLENTSLLPVVGRFTDMPQGRRITLEHDGRLYDFTVDYFGGDGNDLVLLWADTALAGWGDNSFGQLGQDPSNGGPRNRPAAAEIPAGTLLENRTVKAVGAGYLHSLALTADGMLAAWGYNAHGQLGNGEEAHSHEPVAVDLGAVPDGAMVVAVSAGPYHNLALCDDGTVLAWGMNNFGQLGDGSTETRRVPVVVPPHGALEGRRVVAVAAGAYQSFALCSDGTVAAWGYNGEGELGDGTTTTTSVPVQVHHDGALGGRRVVELAAGAYHTLARTDDGGLYCWGYNRHGHVGDGTTTDAHEPVDITASGALAGRTVKAITAGASHSYALADDGALLAWGRNHRSQLAAAEPEMATEPVLATVPDGVEIARLQTGADFGLLRATDGGLLAWGDNGHGQLGAEAGAPRAEMLAPDLSGLEFPPVILFAATGSGARHTLAVAALPRDHEAPPSDGQAAGNETLAEWRMRHFGTPENAGDAANDADPNRDGVPNIAKYAFGSCPWHPCDSRMPAPERIGDRMGVRFPAPQQAGPDVIVTVEWSADLAPGGWVELPDSGGDGWMEFLVPEDSPAGFLRFRFDEAADPPTQPAE